MFEMLKQLAADKNSLEAIKLLINIAALVSVVGIFSALLSMRVNVCNQLYARWQSLLFKFADADRAHETLLTPYSKDLTTRTKAHFIAVAYVNLFEEAYRYRQARFAFIWRVLPEPFWDSIVKSMTKQFSNYTYLRTFWRQEQNSFSADFNAFIQAEVIPQCTPDSPSN